MKSNPIFKIDHAGGLRTWQYEVEGGAWRTITGLHHGAKVTSGWSICVPRSRPTAEEQARFEADAEEKKKLAVDYHVTIDTVGTPKIFMPMLAEKYDPRRTAGRGQLYSQPKLDGKRCIADAAGLWSRDGKTILGVPHILNVLQSLFEHDPDLVLDGELYNHELKSDFNKIMSVVSKRTPDEKQSALATRLVQYHVYDMPSVHGNFGERSVMIAPLLDGLPGIVVVDTMAVIDQAHLDEVYAGYQSQGYEGQIVRLDSPYENRRTHSLLKRKEFLTGEFEIDEVIEGDGNWAGYAKALRLKMPDERIFGSGIRGNQSYTRKLLEKAEYWRGKMATIRYQNLTPDGIPRFPVAVELHSGEGPA